MMKCRTALLALLLLLICSISANANPTVKFGKVTVSGGAIVVPGTVALDKGDTWIGAGFYCTDTTSKQIYPGVINLPMGNPTAGGAAVPFTGGYSILPKGTYTYTVKISYSTGGMNNIQNSGSGFTVP